MGGVNHIERFSKFLCLCLMLFQAILLNLYMSEVYENYRWMSWFLCDAIVIGVWFVVLRMARQNYNDRRDMGKNQNGADEIKFAYIGWTVYAVFLCPRVIILFEGHAAALIEEDFLGPNLLKVALATTALIFLMMVFGFHNAKESIQRKFYLSTLVGAVTLDLYDSTDMLEFLFEPADSKFPAAFSTATLTFTCISFFLPVLALIEIRMCFEGTVVPLSFKVVYSLSCVFLINLPNLVIRSLLWHRYQLDVSVLLMKNVMCICAGAHEIYEYFREEHPRKCPACKDLVHAFRYERHVSLCNHPIGQDDNASTGTNENKEQQSPVQYI